MAHRVLLTAVFVIAVASPALADWWIVRASDGKCIVVDIEPTGKDKDVTRVGKDVYQTPDQAEADVKRFCKESKPAK
jgi:SepF-like predicted cell division protein (DUF552 family)